MQNQVLAISFTLVFLSLEAIWLITIRNRYIILVSLATILFGVQVLSFLIIRDSYVMGNGYFLERLGKLLLKDGLLILAIWILFYTPSFKRLKEIPLSNSTGGLKALLITFDQLVSEVKPITKTALLLLPCIAAFIFTPGMLLLLIPLFWPVLIGEILQFPMYFYFSPIQRFLPSFLVGYDNTAAISGWLLYFWLVISIILTKRSFWLILYFLFLFLLFNNVVGCGRSMANM